MAEGERHERSSPVCNHREDFERVDARLEEHSRRIAALEDQMSDLRSDVARIPTLTVEAFIERNHDGPDIKLVQSQRTGLSGAALARIAGLLGLGTLAVTGHVEAARKLLGALLGGGL